MPTKRVRWVLSKMDFLFSRENGMRCRLEMFSRFYWEWSTESVARHKTRFWYSTDNKSEEALQRGWRASWEDGGRGGHLKTYSETSLLGSVRSDLSVSKKRSDIAVIPYDINSMYKRYFLVAGKKVKPILKKFTHTSIHIYIYMYISIYIYTYLHMYCIHV